MVKYERHFKRHVLLRDYTTETGLQTTGATTSTIELTKGGRLTLLTGFKWNGATGIPDARCLMTGSAVHDALYKLIDRKLIDKKHRKAADKLMLKLFLEHNTWPPIAYAAYGAVRVFGRYFCR